MADPSCAAAALYHIRVHGQLAEQWANWFDGMTLANLPEGDAVLSGVLPDQSALYGVLRQIHNLGLTLISVQRIELGPDGDKPAVYRVC